MALDVLSEKLPPQSLEAEQSVLGAILIENNAILKCIEALTANDFYREAHRKIYASMLDLFDRSEPIDLVTVKNHLSTKGELEAVGGPMYLATLANQIATAANVRYHAEIVGEKALLRALLRTGTDIAAKVYEDAHEAKELMDYAEKSIFEISERHIKSDFSHLREIVNDSFKMIEELYEKKETITGVPSGLHGPRRYDVGVPARRLGRDRGTALDGQDRLRAQHRAVRRHDAQGAGRGIQP